MPLPTFSTCQSTSQSLTSVIRGGAAADSPWPLASRSGSPGPKYRIRARSAPELEPPSPLRFITLYAVLARPLGSQGLLRASLPASTWTREVSISISYLTLPQHCPRILLDALPTARSTAHCLGSTVSHIYGIPHGLLRTDYRRADLILPTPTPTSPPSGARDALGPRLPSP